MTDHPMSCYPGQFEPWRPEVWMGIGVFYIPAEEMSAHYDGAETGVVRVGSVISATRAAINRAMSGQITSSTGDNNAR